jgi:hypothetical protein
MSGLDHLLACAGEWRGVNRLYESPDGPAEESASRVVVTPLLGGRFVRVDQWWACGGDEQEGSLLIGYEPKTGVATGHWIDTFHMGRKVMACSGAIRDDGTVDLRGSYAAPPGPDWGWRIVVGPDADGGLEIVMYNVDPEGKEALAVRATHASA